MEIEKFPPKRGRPGTKPENLTVVSANILKITCSNYLEPCAQSDKTLKEITNE